MLAYELNAVGGIPVVNKELAGWIKFKRRSVCKYGGG